MKRDGTRVERGTRRTLLGATSGVVFAEYVSVLGFTVVVTTAILLAVGLIQLPGYQRQREALYQPYP